MKSKNIMIHSKLDLSVCYKLKKEYKAKQCSILYHLNTVLTKITIECISFILISLSIYFEKFNLS